MARIREASLDDHFADLLWRNLHTDPQMLKTGFDAVLPEFDDVPACFSESGGTQTGDIRTGIDPSAGGELSNSSAEDGAIHFTFLFLCLHFQNFRVIPSRRAFISFHAATGFMSAFQRAS